MKKLYHWLKNRLSHKLEHFSTESIKKTLKEHGLALVVIIVGWEIIEDVVFPILFAVLGKFVHPAFYAGIPAAWILCFHWIAVPLVWGWWIRISKKSKKGVDISCDCD